jgi:heat shock protein HslJ
VGGSTALLGPVNTADGRITLSVWVRTQRAGEDQPSQELGRWLTALLEARPAWQLFLPRLRLSAAGTVVELTDRLHDEPLEGTRWAGRAMIGGRVRGPVPGLHQVFLVFNRGWVTGSDGRHPLSGPAVVSGDTIDFGPGPSMASGTVAAAADKDLAQHLLAALHGTVRYRIQLRQLMLRGADADAPGTGLLLTAGPASAPGQPGPGTTWRLLGHRKPPAR